VWVGVFLVGGGFFVCVGFGGVWGFFFFFFFFWVFFLVFWG